MKNKNTLLLMEQAVLLVVFAMAAAVCLRLFVWADDASRTSLAEDNALIQAQNGAEQIKHHAGDLALVSQSYGGSFADGVWQVSFDEGWNQAAQGPYTLRASAQPQDNPCLGRANVVVTDGDGNILAQLTASWQEDGP